MHGEVCAKILCSEKELLNLKDLNFYSNKTGLGHIYYVCIVLLAFYWTFPMCRKSGDLKGTHNTFKKTRINNTIQHT